MRTLIPLSLQKLTSVSKVMNILIGCSWGSEHATCFQGSYSGVQWEHHCKWKPSPPGRVTPELLCGLRGPGPYYDAQGKDQAM